jgi:hypothetical protein
LLVPYCLLLLFAASVVLASRSPLYAAALSGQCALYLLAGYGAWLDRQAVLRAERNAASKAPIWSRPRTIDRSGAVNA